MSYVRFYLKIRFWITISDAVRNGLRNILRQILSENTVMDNFFGCGKERPKEYLTSGFI